jgi:hypothetical protein
MSSKGRRRAKMREKLKAVTTPAPSSPSRNGSQPWRSRVRGPIRSAGKFITGLLAVYGAATAVEDVSGGPFWPAELDVQPLPFNAKNPFQIPFSVKNPSTVFDAEEVQFTCNVHDLVINQSSMFQENVLISGPFTIQPGGVLQQACYAATGFNVKKAKISIVITRKTAWPGSAETVAGPFVWHPELNPPVWLEENFIRDRDLSRPPAKRTD